MKSTRKTSTDWLFEECEECGTLADCPHPEVANDMMGSPLPPEGCPKPIEVMRDTLKIKKSRYYINQS